MTTPRHVVMMHLLGSGANPLYECWEAACFDCGWRVDSDAWRDRRGAPHRLTKEGVEELRRRHETAPELVFDRRDGCPLPSGCWWCR